MTGTIWKRAALLPPLIFALWLLTDDESQVTNLQDGNHHLAVVTALKRHPPSLRVYRSLFEFNLMLWGTAFALLVWSRSVGSKIVGHLLFQPVGLSRDELGRNLRRYYPVGTADEEENDDDDDDLQPDDAGEDPNDINLGVSKNDPEPPSPETVASVALDSLLVILISLFLFTISSAEGGQYVDGINRTGGLKLIAMIAAPIFPLLLFLGLLMYIIFPLKQRVQFWIVISYTIGAPIHEVTFRDGFIGDILTSSVRPLQDAAFTIFYLASGLKGWWTERYDLDQADLPLETNWLLHTCILPMCMVSPLWWRFLQNLRQSYDAKRRWPYLGNAFKYFLAAEVGMFGIFHPSRKNSILWLSSFVLATMYQIWWDVFMDWELLTFEGGRVRLRNTRVYQSKWTYWGIFVINFVLRFCWTLSFLPPHYLNKAGVLSATFEGDVSNVLSPLIASAEIIRRTLWGLLRLELEAIKASRVDPSLKGKWSDNSNTNEDQLEMQPMTMDSMEAKGKEQSTVGMWVSSDMSMLNDLQILGELCLWATAFAILGMVAAAHRITL